MGRSVIFSAATSGPVLGITGLVLCLSILYILYNRSSLAFVPWLTLPQGIRLNRHTKPEEIPSNRDANPEEIPGSSSDGIPETRDHRTHVLANKDLTKNNNKTISARDYFIEGHVKPGGKYAVYSCSTTQGDVMNYAFPLPLTALAWKRIGFGSIITLVGDSKKWKTTPVLSHVYSNLRKLNCVLVFLNISEQNEIMLSQTSRLFVANLLNVSQNEPYLLTTDADMWPLRGDIYRLPQGKDILSLNSGCCGSFKHTNNRTYQMLPMGYVGMYQSTWKAAITRHGLSPRSVADIVEYLLKEFGEVVLQPVSKGMNLGWFLDQRLVSVMVFDWMQNGTDRKAKVHFGVSSIGGGRIDRAWWNPHMTEDKMDSHILTHGYRNKTWGKLTPLLKELHAEEDYKFCEKYADRFRKLL